MSNNPESQTGKDDSGREYGLNFLGTLKEDALSILEVRDFLPPDIDIGYSRAQQEGWLRAQWTLPGDGGNPNRRGLLARGNWRMACFSRIG